MVNAHLLFDRIDELVVPQATEPTGEATPPEKSTKSTIYDLIDAAFSMETVGISSVATQVKSTSPTTTASGKSVGGRKGKVYSEQTEKAKRENGMAGEIAVFKELMQLYPETTRWVSGNAQQANRIDQGDDSCGYDMYYIDEAGAQQYVEVKASKSEEIIFSLSDNELKFALSHARNYEIFYVVIGDDGMPKHEVWRLGHLFDFSEGEELMHNDRFTLESKEYSITAKRKPC